MGERIVMRVGDAGAVGMPIETVCYPELVIGELDGPVGVAFATLVGDQVKGHTRVFVLLDTDIQVRPVTLMVSKATPPNAKYIQILFGTVQAGYANGILDAVRNGDIPKDKVNDLGIIVSAWLDPRIVDIENLDHKALFESNREAMARAIHKAMNNKPDIDWLLANQDRITHEVYRMSLEGRDY